MARQGAKFKLQLALLRHSCKSDPVSGAARGTRPRRRRRDVLCGWRGHLAPLQLVPPRPWRHIHPHRPDRKGSAEPKLGPQIHLAPADFVFGHRSVAIWAQFLSGSFGAATLWFAAICSRRIWARPRRLPQLRPAPSRPGSISWRADGHLLNRDSIVHGRPPRAPEAASRQPDSVGPDVADSLGLNVSSSPCSVGRSVCRPADAK